MQEKQWSAEKFDMAIQELYLFAHLCAEWAQLCQFSPIKISLFLLFFHSTSCLHWWAQEERTSCLEGHCQYQSNYRNYPRCGDGDVSPEFGSDKSAMWLCGALDSTMAVLSLLLLNFQMRRKTTVKFRDKRDSSSTSNAGLSSIKRSTALTGVNAPWASRCHEAVLRRKMLTEGAGNISVRVQWVWRRCVAVCEWLAGQWLPQGPQSLSLRPGRFVIRSPSRHYGTSTTSRSFFVFVAHAITNFFGVRLTAVLFAPPPPPSPFTRATCSCPRHERVWLSPDVVFTFGTVVT